MEGSGKRGKGAAVRMIADITMHMINDAMPLMIS
jgi:hypothetical protein